MKSLFAAKRKMIFAVLISLIIIINLTVILVSQLHSYLNESAAEIVEKKTVDSISFCVDKDFFKTVPPFTADGVQEALKNGFNCFLIDVYKTKDGKIVCAQDGKLEAITQAEGRIKDHTYFQLLNYNLVFNKKTTEYSFILAENLVASCIESGLTPIVYPHEITSSKEIETVLKPYEHTDLIVVMSDDFGFLRDINKSFPSIKLWYKTDEATDDSIEKLNLLTNTQIVFNAANKRNNDETVAKFKEKQLTFGCYGVNKRSLLKEFSSLGANDIITSKFAKYG